MVDTIKIRRPKFSRRDGGPGGRVEHDPLGNAVWKRTRANDSAALPDTSALSILDEVPAAPSAGSATERKGSPDGPPLKPKRKP